MSMINRVIHGDCLEVMRKITDQSVDLVISDPPYLMNYKSNRRVKSERFDHILNDKDSHDLISDYLRECYRILKNDSAIYIFCSWHQVDFFKREIEKYFKLKNLIVWNKNNHGSGDLKGSYAPKHELILYAHKGRSLFREKRIPDVIECAKINSKDLLHPTQKPLDLLDIFIRNNSDPGDVVFDGFAGSGATAVSALRNNRKFIVCELDKQYFEIAQKRIKEETL